MGCGISRPLVVGAAKEDGGTASSSPRRAEGLEKATRVESKAVPALPLLTPASFHMVVRLEAADHHPKAGSLVRTAEAAQEPASEKDVQSPDSEANNDSSTVLASLPESGASSELPRPGGPSSSGRSAASPASSSSEQSSGGVKAASKRRPPSRHTSLPTILASRLSQTSSSNSSRGCSVDEMPVEAAPVSAAPGSGPPTALVIDAALSSQPAAGISPSPRRPPLPRSASSNSRNSSRNNSFRRPPQLAVPPAPVRPPGEGGGLPEPPEPQAPAGGSAPLKVSQEWFRDLPDPLKAMERLMKSDPQMFKRIQASMRGIGSLATETTELNMKRDRTGATVINQYVVIKTLGQGSYGKVKLVLNTLDGQLYAVKMVLRTGAMASNRASSLLRKGSRARQNSMRLNDSGVLPPLLSELNGGRKARSLRETDTQSLFETERSQSLRESGGSSHSSTLPHAQRERLRPLGLKSSSIDEATVDEERRSLSLNCLPTVTVDEERRSQSLSGVETAPTSTVHSSPSGSGRVGSGRVGSGRVDLHGSSLGGAPLGGMALAESLGVQKVDQEIAIMKKMDHPHVVKLHEVIDPPGSKYIMLVMEYMDLGPVQLTSSQAGFAPLQDEQEARHYFRQAAQGLDYLHYNNVAHGDLKPENLLMCYSGEVKISDFGSSRVMESSSSSSGSATQQAASSDKLLGTPAFQPPEAVTGQAGLDPFAADVWALGVCLYCFIFGHLPFTGKSVLDIYNAIATEPLVLRDTPAITPELASLLQAMLAKDPAKRAKLQDVLEHPWLTLDGSPPLMSLRKLTEPPQVVQITSDEAQQAIDTCSPVSLIAAKMKEQTLQPGDILFKQGDKANCVFMVMSGVVELFMCHTPGQPSITPRTHMPRATTDDPEQSGEFAFDVDDTFTTAADYAGLRDKMDRDGCVRLDRASAQELARRQRLQVLSEEKEVVMGVRGPGQVVGHLGDEAMPLYQHSARARERCLVIKLTEDNLWAALVAAHGREPGVDPLAAGSFRNSRDSSFRLSRENSLLLVAGPGSAREGSARRADADAAAAGPQRASSRSRSPSPGRPAGTARSATAAVAASAEAEASFQANLLTSTEVGDCSSVTGEASSVMDSMQDIRLEEAPPCTAPAAKGAPRKAPLTYPF